MKYKKLNPLQFISTAILLVISFTAHAADFVVEASIQSGGADIVKVYNQGFGSSDVETISAGGGLGMLLGANIAMTNNTYLKTLTGIVSQSISGYSGSVLNTFEFNWQHIPIEVLYMKKSNKWNFGGGLVYHLNPKFSSSGVYAGNDIGFDNALGLKIAFDYRFSTDIFLGMEFTSINYKVNSGNVSSNSVNGSSAGLVLGYIFAK